ncbi:glycosyltransferase involved in cell wall biosynthesis [Lacibacter cauensis]|uniref:Glycosyltransferase involved in cell wall biosynthesis n=1 Tax=Lacibacter cauensis TaxID=510947 RepID=A0A562SQY8_9BACT|nr:glycosyltransferase [Lacibacter cauensis]TWI83677.1 glycosyltransferase involved in cell wall biosynthesis [Lacibacter cauensis]
MRIVHVVEPFASGVVTFVKSLVEHLPEDYHIVIHGERPEVMERAEVKKLFPPNQVKFIHWKSAQRGLNIVKDTRALFELFTILKRFRTADAVHLHSSKSGFLGRLVCRWLNIKQVIYTPNGAPFLVKDSRIKRLLYKQLELIGHSFGGKVVCVSASEAEAYRNLGIEATYINNGTSSLKQVRNADNNEGKFIIAFSGRILAQKNPKRFNEIAEHFLAYPQVEFVWIGDGADRYLLSSSNIRITGWLLEEDVKKELSKASLYLSTADYEGLSFGVLDAMSLGKPLILSNCTGNKDIIRYGVNGDLYDSIEQACTQILYYINNPFMLEAMGSYSKSLCNTEFNAASSAGNYRIAYAY